LCVVDDADQRPRFGRVRKQRQHREADEETIGALTRHQAESRSQRVALRRRQPLEAFEQGQAELVQRSKRKLQLRLDANGANDCAAFALAGGVVEKGRLSHAGLATQDERAALATAHRSQQLIEPRTLAGAATKKLSRDPGDADPSDHSGSSCPLRLSCPP